MMATENRTNECQFCGESIRQPDPDGTPFEWVADDESTICEESGEYGFHQPTEETEAPNIWAMLEEDAPNGCEAVQDLYSWSLNYDAGKGPFTLLLDLIGWSEDEIGEPMYNLTSSSLGYVELDKLASALKEYADRPHEVRGYVDALMEAEGR